MLFQAPRSWKLGWGNFEVSVDERFAALQRSLSSRRARSTRHRLWSNFIRKRDGGRCLVCESREGLAAHHIVRRCLLPEAQFFTGNGITLCYKCHKEAHQGFNRSPDVSLPVDAQGGEKLEAVAELYRLLAKSYLRNYCGHEEYFYISGAVLDRFKIMQGFQPADHIRGAPIEQAWFIWDCAPISVVEALVRANLPRQ